MGEKAEFVKNSRENGREWIWNEWIKTALLNFI